MVFEKRLAKIGSGINVNLYPKNQTEIEIIIYNNSCKQKTLNYVNERYNLELNNIIYPYDEVIKLSNDLLLVKIKNNIKLVKCDV